MRSPAKLLLLTAGLLILLVTSTWLVVRDLIAQNKGAGAPIPQEAHWSFHPDHPPDPTSRTLVVLANDIQCASGIPPNDRLLPPEVHESPREVVITFSAKPPPGSAGTCPTHPAVTRTITLSQPIGDRSLLDGWYSPPRPVDESTRLLGT